MSDGRAIEKGPGREAGPSWMRSRQEVRDLEVSGSRHWRFTLATARLDLDAVSGRSDDAWSLWWLRR